MNKDTLRMVIGFGIVLVILIVWQMAFRPKPRPAAPAPVAADTVVPAPVETAAAEPEAAPARDTAPALPAALRADSAVPARTEVLENDFLRAEFSSIGGGLTSCRLKKYDAELVPEGEMLFPAGLWTENAALDLSAVPMRVSAGRDSVSFSSGDESLGITRTFRLDGDYTLILETRVTGARGWLVQGGAGMAITEQNAKDDLSHFHFYARGDGKLKRSSARDLGKKPVASGAGTDWVGLKSKYFFIAAFDSGAVYDSSWAFAREDGRIGFGTLTRAGSNPSAIRLYLGPLDYDRLHSFGRGFENTVSLGWAKPIALGILWLLKFLYRVFGNWGVAIIIFSIIMKAIFFPLTRTQTKQMRQMQLLQPKLTELKAKYKDNPQALNQETMQLYKLYKINPLSGCLPMLVQLPVFWALYSVLRTFIDLRGASFVLWLKDLSQPDALFGHLPFFGNPPIGLLPILMGVSFIAQNMLTSTDKKNWALTIIFPIFITAIFLNFPSGLQLYWFMYNVLSILESVIGLKGGRKWLKKKPRKDSDLTTVGVS